MGLVTVAVIATELVSLKLVKEANVEDPIVNTPAPEVEVFVFETDNPEVASDVIAVIWKAFEPL